MIETKSSAAFGAKEGKIPPVWPVWVRKGKRSKDIEVFLFIPSHKHIQDENACNCIPQTVGKVAGHG